MSEASPDVDDTRERACHDTEDGYNVNAVIKCCYAGEQYSNCRISYLEAPSVWHCRKRAHKIRMKSFLKLFENHELHRINQMTWKSVLMQFRTIDCERSQIIQNRTTNPSSVPFSNNDTAGLERDIRLKYIQAGMYNSQTWQRSCFYVFASTLS